MDTEYVVERWKEAIEEGWISVYSPDTSPVDIQHYIDLLYACDSKPKRKVDRIERGRNKKMQRALRLTHWLENIEPRLNVDCAKHKEVNIYYINSGIVKATLYPQSDKVHSQIRGHRVKWIVGVEKFLDEHGFLD